MRSTGRSAALAMIASSRPRMRNVPYASSVANAASRPARPETAGGTSSSAPLPFGGTAVLIMIGVGLDTVKQIESQLMQRNYEGFLE